MQDAYLVIAYAIIYVCGVLVLYIIGLAGAWDNQFGFVPHHYFIALALIPLTRFLNPISATTQALLAGIFVEGVARWNFQWMYHNTAYHTWFLLYMQWLRRGREPSLYNEEDEQVGAQVLGRVF